MGAFILPVICGRCGSRDVRWLGETKASVFVRCERCRDVWRLDPLVDEARLLREHESREPDCVTGHA